MTWKRIIAWVGSSIVGLVLVTVVGAVLFLHTQMFRAYALRKISAETYAATGARAEIRELDLSLSELTARLHDITLHGKERAAEPALLKADQLTVAVKIQSLLHPRVTLREIQIDHPVVHVDSDKNGNSNLPAPPPSQTTSHTSVFDLAIGHLRINNGEIDYRDLKTPTEGDLYNLATDVHFDGASKSYRGTISYSNGRLRYASYSPLPHDLEATFVASSNRFTVEPASLKVGSSILLLRASLSNYSSPVAEGDYELKLHSEDFASFAPSTSPSGDIAIRGKLHYRSSPNQPFVRSIAMDGLVSSAVVSVAASGSNVEVRNLKGQYRLANGTLDISDVRLETLGGKIAGYAKIDHLDSTPESNVRVASHGISLRAAQQTMHQKALRDVAIFGALNGTVEAVWKGSINNVEGRADLTVGGAAGPSSNGHVREVPVNGVVHAIFNGRRNSLALHDTQFKIPSTTLTAQGEVSDRSNLQIQVSTVDLHELIAIANSFCATSTPPPAVSGTASLNATVRGAMRTPNLSGHFSAQNVAVEGSEWRSAKLDVHANPTRIAVQNGSLISTKGGEASFSAQASLRNWAYQPSDRLQGNLSVRGLLVEDLERLANEQLPVSGVMTANVSLDGTQLDPKGSGFIRVAKARAWDEPLQDVTMKFNGANGSIISTLELVAAPGQVKADLSYAPKTKGYKIHLDAPGIILQKLRMIQQENLSLSGTVSASVDGEGTVDNPQLTATVRAPELALQKGSVGNLNANVRVASHRADLKLQSTVADASISANGRVDLTGNYYSEFAIDSGPISLVPLMAMYATAVPDGFQGKAEFHGALKGPLKDKSRIEAHITIPTLNAAYQSLEVGLANPLHADLAKSILTLQPAEIRGTDTSLHVQGNLPLAGNSSPNLSAQGSIDMRILKVLAPDMQSAGVVALDVHTSGAADHPIVNGQINVKNVSFTTSDAPLGVEKLNGTLDLSTDRVRVSSMTGEVGGGKVSIGGSILYKPNMQFNLALQGQSIRLRYPEGLRTLLDTNLAFSGTREASTLSGRVLVDSLSFSPDFDLSKFSDQFSTGATTPSQPGFADTVKLSINVQSKENLKATSTQVSIGGRADLRVIGTAANPVITGRTNLTSGELFYRNVRYELQRGVITFDNPNETRPVMNVVVTTTVEQYNLTLTMRGPLDKLTTSYVSDPPLATADIINLIARGKTTQEANASSQSTDSMIASGAASELSGSVQKLAGLSSLQIDPLLGGNNQNPSARIALQQRVSKNLLFSFSTDVSQPGSEIVQGEYQITKRWSASVTRDQLGGVSVDGKYRTRF